jgi:spore germination protein GerM
MTRRAMLLVLGLVAVLTAACGVPTDESARPFNISANAAQCSGPSPITVYFVDASSSSGSRLKGVQRRHVANAGDSALCALEALNAGPTPDEFIEGLATAFQAIPEGLTLLAPIRNGVATVQLDAPFVSNFVLSSLAEAYGQIVFTLTGLPNAGITEVQFIFENEPYPGVVTPNGRAVNSGRVSRSQYCAIAPVGARC